MSVPPGPLLVLFDIDGTLVDTAGAGRRAIASAFERVLAPPGLAAELDAIRFAGMTDWSIFDALAVRLELSSAYDERRDEVHEAYFASLTAEMAGEDRRRRVLPGVAALLDDLAPRPDVHLGLLTGNFERGARIKLEPFGLNRYFAVGGFGSDSPDRREVARIAVATMARRAAVEFAARSVVVVGDTEHDVDCALANGYRALAVASGWGRRETMERMGPDLLLDDLVDRVRVLEFLGLPGQVREG